MHPARNVTVRSVTMPVLFSLVLWAGLADLSQGSPEKPLPVKIAVPVLKADAVFSNAIEQVATASPKLGYEVPTPVSSLEAGLFQVQKTSDRPILAMAEAGGWFFYATSVVRDGKTGKPVCMISGYAVKRYGRRVIGWGVW
jgi:hypothetical protein